MKSESELWNGVTLSSSREEIVESFPLSREFDDKIHLSEFVVAGSDFQAVAHFGERGLHKVVVSLTRLRGSSLPYLESEVIRQLSQEYGRGERRYVMDGVLKKRWLRRYIDVDLTVVRDGIQPVLSIDYASRLYRRKTYF